MIRVFLVDDHKIVREGLKLILKNTDGIEVVGESGSAQEGLEKIAVLKPDVALLDITMPKMNGLEMTKILTVKYPNTNVLILSMHESEEYILESIQSGAKGYVLKDSPSTEIIDGIKKVSSGEKFYGNSASVLLAEAYVKKNENKITTKKPYLSKRQMQVLTLLQNGKANKDIAEQLDLSLRTVETHRFNMMKKAGAKNLIELLNKVEKEGWSE